MTTDSLISSKSAAQWRPVYWEPVAGTGERLMAGVVGHFANDWHAKRLLRDDVLESLYGERAAGAKKLIDQALLTALLVARHAGLESFRSSIMGLTPGAIRNTSARDFAEVLRQAALLYSSLTNLDSIDSPDEDANQRVEDGNKRFGAEVKATIAAMRPDLKEFLGKSAPVSEGGMLVRFGFLSPKLAAQFAVLHPVRQSSSVSTARSKIFELQRVQHLGSSKAAALVLAIPHEDSAVFGKNQRDTLRANRDEIYKEANDVGVQLSAVTTVMDGANAIFAMNAA